MGGRYQPAVIVAGRRQPDVSLQNSHKLSGHLQPTYMEQYQIPSLVFEEIRDMIRRLSLGRLILAVAFTAAGIFFFFVIIGVFGVRIAIVGLVLLLTLAIFSFYRKAREVD
jgi:hypothetical protein